MSASQNNDVVPIPNSTDETNRQNIQPTTTTRQQRHSTTRSLLFILLRLPTFSVDRFVPYRAVEQECLQDNFVVYQRSAVFVDLEKCNTTLEPSSMTKAGWRRTRVSKLRAKSGPRNHSIRQKRHFVNNENILYLRKIC